MNRRDFLSKQSDFKIKKQTKKKATEQLLAKPDLLPEIGIQASCSEDASFRLNVRTARTPTQKFSPRNTPRKIHSEGKTPLKRVEESHKKRFKALLADSPRKHESSSIDISNKENKGNTKGLLNNTCELEMEGMQKLNPSDDAQNDKKKVLKRKKVVVASKYMQALRSMDNSFGGHKNKSDNSRDKSDSSKNKSDSCKNMFETRGLNKKILRTSSFDKRLEIKNKNIKKENIVKAFPLSIKPPLSSSHPIKPHLSSPQPTKPPLSSPHLTKPPTSSPQTTKSFFKPALDHTKSHISMLASTPNCIFSNHNFFPSKPDDISTIKPSTPSFLDSFSHNLLDMANFWKNPVVKMEFLDKVEPQQTEKDIFLQHKYLQMVYADAKLEHCVNKQEKKAVEQIGMLLQACEEVVNRVDDLQARVSRLQLLKHACSATQQLETELLPMEEHISTTSHLYESLMMKVSSLQNTIITKNMHGAELTESLKTVLTQTHDLLNLINNNDNNKHNSENNKDHNKNNVNDVVKLAETLQELMLNVEEAVQCVQRNQQADNELYRLGVDEAYLRCLR